MDRTRARRGTSGTAALWRLANSLALAIPFQTIDADGHIAGSFGVTMRDRETWRYRLDSSIQEKPAMFHALFTSPQSWYRVVVTVVQIENR
jgi:hypothetical protein